MRLPLIPGYNDSAQDLKAIAEFLSELGLSRLDILPYHQLGASKYTRLGKRYELGDVKSYTEDEVELIKHTLETFGLDVRIA